MLRDTWDRGEYWDPYTSTNVPIGVMVSCEGLGEGNQFKDAGGVVREFLYEPEEVCQGVVDSSGQHYLLTVYALEGFLNLEEEASCTRKGNHR